MTRAGDPVSQAYQRAARFVAVLCLIQTFVWIIASVIDGWTAWGRVLCVLMACVSLTSAILLGVFGDGEFHSQGEVLDA